MHLSDADLLCAAQSGGDAGYDARKELPIRFERLLLYFAHHACRLNSLPLPEADDIIQLALLKVLTTKTPFDPARGGVEAYLRGLVQTAARSHRRFLRPGTRRRHDWADAENGRLGLPTTVEAIADDFDAQAGTDARDGAAAVLAIASVDERGLVHDVFYRSISIKDVGISIGVDPSTVSRRLTRLYSRVLARCGPSCGDN
jgi:RNA polymerase sigma factor (sigma-70 family)